MAVPAAKIHEIAPDQQCFGINELRRDFNGAVL